MRKVLTPDLISAKTRCDNLFLIKNLNLWGNEIEDVRLLRQMPNLEILSLSVNRISSLKEFSSCKKLQELYLRKNNITDLEEIRYLIDLPDLRILWLLDNPCSEQESYREIVISTLPNIRKLDNKDISEEERKSAELSQKDRKVEIKRNLSPGGVKPRTSFYEPQEKSTNNIMNQNQARSRVFVEKDTFDDKKESFHVRKETNDQRKENVLCAVLALIKELDQSELEFLKRDIDRKLGIIFRYFNCN